MFNNKRNNNKRATQRNEEKLFSELIVLRRVAKVTSGAKRLRFSVVVIAGDKKGNVGIALGRGADAQEAIQKATKKAGNSLLNIPITADRKTIPHRVEAEYKAASVMIKPAPIGTGVVAGGAVRKVLEIAGVENVVAKCLNSSNPLTNAYCAVLALSKLKKIEHGNHHHKDSSK